MTKVSSSGHFRVWHARACFPGVKNSHPSPGLDLMKTAPLGRLIRSLWFPYVFQALLLLVFFWLAVISWGRHAPEGVPSKLYAKANLVNLLVWGLWWPVMVWIAVWLGRVWCLVCPMELVSNIGERISRALHLPQGRLTGWVAAGGLIALFYFLIQMCVAGLELHRVPAHTSAFLFTLLGVALLTGLFLKDRAFCRGFCPVGLLLNVYGRGGMVAARPKEDQPCRDCAGRDCKVGRNRHALDARSCPSLLNPSKLETNAECLLCCQCLKSCEPGNLALRLRRPFSAADWRPVLASWPVTFFVMLVSGFVTYEMFSEWKAAKAVFLNPAEQLTTWLGAGKEAAGWIKGAYVLLVVPAVLWLIAGGLIRLTGGASSLREAWRRLALPMAVVISAGHMGKGLAKVSSWGGYLPGAIREPMGVHNSQALAAKTIPPPTSLLSLPLVSIIGFLLLAVAVWLGIRETRLAESRGYGKRAVPIILLGAFYLFLVAGWGLQ
jgi:hypothetical protein